MIEDDTYYKKGKDRLIDITLLMELKFYPVSR